MTVEENPVPTFELSRAGCEQAGVQLFSSIFFICQPEPKKAADDRSQAPFVRICRNQVGNGVD